MNLYIRGIAVKKMIHIYFVSKYKYFSRGLLFAIISLIALVLCLVCIFEQTNSKLNILFTFGIALLSMIMGLVSMFYKNDISKEEKIVH